MSEPERKRRRKWDVPDPLAKKTTTPEKPQIVASSEKISANSTTTTPEKPQTPSEKTQKDLQAITQVLAARSPGETHTVEIDINSCPAATRFLLTKGQVHEQILKETGAVVITRGVFVPATDLATSASKPLHLHVSAKTKESLNEAEKKIREMMRTSKESAVLGALLLSAQVPITMEVEPEFNLNGKLLGPKGQYLRNITNESGGAKVHLRGRDTTANASEAEQLHIHITASSQNVLDRAKKLAGDLIASVQKQYEEFKQKKAAGPQYPQMVQPYSVPFMPPYPYAPYPAFGGFPPFPGRPPFGYPPRGPGYPPMPGPGYPAVPSTGDPSAPYPNYYQDPNNSNSSHSGAPDTAIKTENNSDSSSVTSNMGSSNTTDNTTSSTTENSVTDQSYLDQMNYYGYGYSQTAGYDSFNYHYGYYPGMESAVGTEKADTVNNGGGESNTNPAGGNSDQAYDYNYPPGAYGELFSSTAAYYDDQRTPSTQN
jgi:type II secretory pathway pseudopilin PulG